MKRWLVFTTIGIAAWFLWRGEREEGVSPPPPKDAGPSAGPKDVYYPTACLENFKCSEDQFSAAVYNYLGSAYGSLDGMPYGEHLSPNERAQLEADFPFLHWNRFPDSREEYFNRNVHQACVVYLSRFSQDRQWDSRCEKNGEIAAEQTFTHPTLGEAVLLRGVRLCAEMFGEFYAQRGWEIKVAAHPDQWIFFIQSSLIHNEGVRRRLAHYLPNFSWSLNETRTELLFTRLAKGIGVPVRDPVVSMESPEIFGRVSATSTLTEMDLAVSSLSRLAARLGDGLNAAETSNDQAKQNCVRMIADEFKVDDDALRRRWEHPAGNSEPQAEVAIQQALDLSIQRSVEKVRSDLRRMGRRYALFILEEHYYPLVGRVYAQEGLPVGSTP